MGRALAAWRAEVVEDLGGPGVVTAAMGAVIDAAAGSWLLLASMDRVLGDWAAEGTLVSKKRRQAARLVQDRNATARTLLGLLQALGLEKKLRPVETLEGYLATRAKGQGEAGEAPP